MTELTYGLVGLVLMGVIIILIIALGNAYAQLRWAEHLLGRIAHFSDPDFPAESLQEEASRNYRIYNMLRGTASLYNFDHKGKRWLLKSKHGKETSD